MLSTGTTLPLFREMISEILPNEKYLIEKGILINGLEAIGIGNIA
jgi:hypothetical protein